MGCLKVLSWNLAVLTEDKIVLWENILQYYDVILCQEWGRREELSELLEDLGFNAYFNDQSVSKGRCGDPPRGAGKGEGICVLVKKFQGSRLIKHTKHATWVEVELLGNKFSLASVYFNPSSSIPWRRDPSMSSEEAKEAAFAALKSDISDIESSSNSKVLVMGDFNAHTGDAPDIDTVADHILEDLGLGWDELVSTSHVPVRRSTMDSSVNDMGRLLLSHCCLDSGLSMVVPMVIDLAGLHMLSLSLIMAWLMRPRTLACSLLKCWLNMMNQITCLLSVFLKFDGHRNVAGMTQGVVKSSCLGGTLQKGKSMYMSWNLLALFMKCVSLVRVLGMGAWTWLSLLRGYTK